MKRKTLALGSAGGYERRGIAQSKSASSRYVVHAAGAHAGRTEEGGQKGAGERNGPPPPPPLQFLATDLLSASTPAKVEESVQLGVNNFMRVSHRLAEFAV